MILTEEILAEKFAEYNKTYFNYVLPTPSFGLLKTYKYCGYFSCKKITGKRQLKGQKIEISSYYDWREEDLRNVIVHEMIHYYLAYKHIDNTLSHGEAFIKMCQELNEKFGTNITIEIDTTDFKRASFAPKISFFFSKLF